MSECLQHIKSQYETLKFSLIVKHTIDESGSHVILHENTLGEALNVDISCCLLVYTDGYYDKHVNITYMRVGMTPLNCCKFKVPVVPPVKVKIFLQTSTTVLSNKANHILHSLYLLAAYIAVS